MNIDRLGNGEQSPQRHRIMVLNDSKDMRELVQIVLEGEGYEVILQNASEGAYPTIKAARPALLILDLVLEKPDSGWQLIQILRLDTETKDIPVIVCSGNIKFLRENEERLGRLGCYVLPKPFNIDDLITTVSSALQGQVT